MSKFRCQCGYVISTVQAPCPFDGWVYGHQVQDQFEAKIEAAVASFLEAISRGERAAWLSDFFLECYPKDLEVSSIISDIITKIQYEYVLAILECESCGRLHVQEEPGVNKYRAYSPEDGQYFGVLKKKTAEPSAAPIPRAPAGHSDGER